MIVLDIENPKSCKVCPLRFEGMCLPQNKHYISWLIDEHERKDWFCPIVAEISEEELEQKGIKKLEDYHGKIGQGD